MKGVCRRFVELCHRIRMEERLFVSWGKKTTDILIKIVLLGKITDGEDHFTLVMCRFPLSIWHLLMQKLCKSLYSIHLSVHPFVHPSIQTEKRKATMKSNCMHIVE